MLLDSDPEALYLEKINVFNALPPEKRYSIANQKFKRETSKSFHVFLTIACFRWREIGKNESTRCTKEKSTQVL